jgi:hypothetical protein
MLALEPDDPSAQHKYGGVLETMGDFVAARAALERALRTAQACGSEYHIVTASCTLAFCRLKGLQAALQDAENSIVPDAVAAKQSVLQATAAEVAEILGQAGRALRCVRQQQAHHFSLLTLEADLRRAQVFASHVLEGSPVTSEELQQQRWDVRPKIQICSGCGGSSPAVKKCSACKAVAYCT